jgi:ADP-L-glycero-D-manno-heptose 6-epimerase
MASILSQMLRQAAAGQPITVFADTLTAARDYLPVRDLTDVLVRLVTDPVPSQVYNVGSGHAVSFAEVLQWCAAFRPEGRLDVRLVPNPVSDRYQRWTCADMSRLREALPGLAQLTIEDVREAAQALFTSFSPAGAVV